MNLVPKDAAAFSPPAVRRPSEETTDHRAGIRGCALYSAAHVKPGIRHTASSSAWACAPRSGCSARQPSGPADTMASSVRPAHARSLRTVSLLMLPFTARLGMADPPHEAAACPSRSRTSDADRIAASGRLFHRRPASLRALMCWASFLGVAACLGTVRELAGDVDPVGAGSA
jgi:hypothetical protein